VNDFQLRLLLAAHSDFGIVPGIASFILPLEKYVSARVASMDRTTVAMCVDFFRRQRWLSTRVLDAVARQYYSVVYRNLGFIPRYIIIIIIIVHEFHHNAGLETKLQSRVQVAVVLCLHCLRSRDQILPRTVCAAVTKTTATYSVGHGLHTLATALRSHQRFALRGIVKVSAFGLSNTICPWWI